MVERGRRFRSDLAGLVRRTRSLPALREWTLSFVAALIAGLLTGFAVAGWGSSRNEDRGPLSIDEAIGQLGLQPVQIAPFNAEEFRTALQRVADGRAGGIVLYATRHLRPEDAAKTRAQVRKLTAAAQGQPPLLVILALEGIRGIPGGCPQTSPVMKALHDALGPSTDPGEARRLGMLVEEFGANALLAANLADEGACGDADHGGTVVDPATLVGGLLNRGVALVVRGAQAPTRQPQMTARYASSGVRLATAATVPDGCPTWLDRRAVSALRTNIGEDVLIATPDLSAVSDRGAGCQRASEVSPRASAATLALRAGVDLVIDSGQPGGAGTQIKRFFEEQRERLLESCVRMVRYKREVLSGSQNGRPCPTRISDG